MSKKENGEFNVKWINKQKKKSKAPQQMSMKNGKIKEKIRWTEKYLS